MEIEIGTKIVTHDNAYTGKIVSLEPIRIGAEAQKKNKVFGKPYVALVAELDETTDSPKGFSTLVAESVEALVARYAVA
jgi:hypothetical protein